MKNTFLIILSLLVILMASCSQTPPEKAPDALEPQFGTPSYDSAYDAAGDSTGIYTVGTTFGSLASANLGGSDAFIVKYGFDGSLLWQKQFGTSGYDNAENIVVNGSRIYALGSTNGSLSGSVGSYDSFLRLYDSAGSVVWTRQFGTTGSDIAVDVAADTSGNAIVLTDDSTSNFSLRKITPTGVVSILGNYTYSTTPYIPTALHLDSANNIYVLLYRNDGTFGRNNVYIFKYNASGTFMGYSYASASVDDDYARDLRVVGSYVYVLLQEGSNHWIRKFPLTISHSTVPVAEVNLGPHVVGYALKAAGSNIYVTGDIYGLWVYAARYTSNLVRQWVKYIPNLGNQSHGYGLAVSAANNSVFSVGRYSFSGDNFSAFIAKFDLTMGSHIWSR